MTTEHTSLYRKYRPTTFDEVLGQEQVVALLRGAIESGNIAHAYLFAGSRGTGKTSLARIFARALGVHEQDMHEIDAASNNSVEDVRSLREEVFVMPFAGEKKLYILDEAHMLSTAAWNALLKTLEEPPAHVLFILATTELHKVPETILSRCQTVQFARPSVLVLKEMVLRVAKKEGYTIEPASADLIALFADGSFRDAHGVLQRVLTTSIDTAVSVAEVERALGAPSGSEVLEVLGAIAARDLDWVLTRVRSLSEGKDAALVLTLLLRAVRGVLLVRVAPRLHEQLQKEYTAEEWQALAKHAKESALTLNAALLTYLLDAEKRVGSTRMPSVPLELALIEFLENKT
jgi:DNA polymerase III subunit gamma/tau